MRAYGPWDEVPGAGAGRPMTGQLLVAHVLLISLHAVAAVGGFVLGVLLVARIPTTTADRRLRAFIALIVVAMGALLAVVVADWSVLPIPKRIVFAALCALAAYVLLRVAGAWRSVARTPAAWRRSFVQHVGFVLISLFDGFCVVAAIDLGLPTAVVVAVAVLGVVAGVLALRRALSGSIGAPPPTAM